MTGQAKRPSRREAAIIRELAWPEGLRQGDWHSWNAVGPAQWGQMMAPLAAPQPADLEWLKEQLGSPKKSTDTLGDLVRHLRRQREGPTRRLGRSGALAHAARWLWPHATWSMGSATRSDQWAAWAAGQASSVSGTPIVRATITPLGSGLIEASMEIPIWSLVPVAQRVRTECAGDQLTPALNGHLLRSAELGHMGVVKAEAIVRGQANWPRRLTDIYLADQAEWAEYSVGLDAQRQTGQVRRAGLPGITRPAPTYELLNARESQVKMTVTGHAQDISPHQVLWMGRPELQIRSGQPEIMTPVAALISSAQWRRHQGALWIAGRSPWLITGAQVRRCGERLMMRGWLFGAAY